MADDMTPEQARDLISVMSLQMLATIARSQPEISPHTLNAIENVLSASEKCAEVLRVHEIELPGAA